ncbi:MAG: hypothetical protein U9N35_03515 [Euryarchaeota archaeon]|nr:hypothetical protein [Euryarchaeota archaeon]
MNEIIEIVALSLSFGLLYVIGILIGSKLSKKITTKRTLGWNFVGAFTGAVIGLFIYMYLLDSKRMFMGFAVGTAIFFAFILSEYFETGQIANKTILKACGILVGFTIGSLLGV